VKHIKNLLAHKYFYLWIAEFWTLVIIILCLVSFNKLPNVGIQSADKYVHFTFHFGFTILWFLYLNHKNPSDKNAIFKVFFASFLFGILIEASQSLFTLTRKADIYDVMANTAGSFAAIITVLSYKVLFKKKST